MATGGWWLVCSQNILVPSSKKAWKVSPSNGLKGFYYLTEQYKQESAKAIVNLNLSILSSISPAYLRYTGANPYQSHILSKRLLGSNILTGSEIPIIL